VDAARQARQRDDGPDDCIFDGVDITLHGWRAGLNKVELTRTFREGGYGLREAKNLTDRLLDGETVTLHLDQFDTLAEAEAALHAIGVADVAEPRSVAAPTP
jgi:hypothetical protein